jgi:hypothetical protein
LFKNLVFINPILVIVESMLLSGDKRMIRTIVVGSCVSVQGQFVRNLDNGRIVIQVGDQMYSGRPIDKAA